MTKPRAAIFAPGLLPRNITKSVKVTLLKPHQLGWLHRSELDDNRTQVWEKPNGELYAHRIADGELRLQIMKYEG